MADSLYEILDDLPALKVIDVGASAIDGDPPYWPLHEQGHVELLGFEPDEKQFAVLQARQDPRATYLKDALGDGREHALRVCQAPGMTSLLEPDHEVLSRFHGFSDWGRVLERVPLSTRRLDDVPEASGTDYIKLDIQGAELMVLQNARKVLAGCVAIHIEVQFIPFYKDQPLFAELDQELRAAGFWLHNFDPLNRRVFKPLLIDGDPYAGLNQLLWGDALYVKRFTDFEGLPPESLAKIAVVAHDLYQSYDLATLALKHWDERDGGDRHRRYAQFIADQLGDAEQ